jgi:hypothetical protein
MPAITGPALETFMNRNLVAVVVAAVALTGIPSFAQQLSVTISPNPVPVGGTVTVTAQAVTPGLLTPNGCLIQSVCAGQPNGTPVGVFGCTFVAVPIPSCGSGTFRQATWTANQPAGNYWMLIMHEPAPFSAITSEWYCVTVHDPVINPAPTLSAVNAATFGNAFEMSLSSPALAGAPYAVALSATTNTGIPYVGGHAALDNDFLLALSLAQPPAYFVNFGGVLDGAGLSPQIFLLIPPVPGATCLPIHAQAAILLGPGSFVLSNALPITIH